MQPTTHSMQPPGQGNTFALVSTPRRRSQGQQAIAGAAGLRCLAITDTDAVLAWDGAAEELRPSLMRLAEEVLTTGRTVVVAVGYPLSR